MLITDVRPVRRVYLGLVAEPYDALSTVVWTEVPAELVKSSSLKWGAQHELARVEPSRATVRFDNVDGDFEALNPASPYYPDLRPLNRLRIVDTWPANLLTANQESLESGTTGWAADTNCTVSQTVLAAHQGSASLAITAIAAGLMAARTPTGTSGVPVVSGTRYEAHLYVRAGAATTMATSVVVRWFDAAGAFISDSGSLAITAVDSKFTPLSSVVLAPAGAAFAAVLPVMTAVGAGHVGFVDSISFAPAYVRFTGYVSDWPRSWTGINQSVAQVEAWDALGAVLNAVDIPETPWELQVRRFVDEATAAGGKAVWLRLGETSSTVAADSSGYALDGQYQGSPVLGLDGLVPGDDDKAIHVAALSRVSLPFKNLISGYPASVSFRFRLTAERASQHIVLYATDGPTGTPAQWVRIYVDATSGLYPGQMRAEIRNGAQQFNIRTSGTVDDGFDHHCVVVWNSASSASIYLDGVDVTLVGTSLSPAWPNDLLTGYAVGNTPAVTFGDFGFGRNNASDTLDELVVLDGLALGAADVADLYASGVILPALFSRSGQRLNEVLDAVGWPGADRAIDTGLTVVQQNYVAGKLNAYMQRLDVTEGGRLFVDGAGVLTFHDRHKVLQAPYTTSQATFGEGAGEIGYHPPFSHGEDDADIFNDIPVGNVGGTVQVARSLTSRARYGWKTLTGLTDLLGTSNEEAKDRASRDLAIYSEPTTRVRQLVVKPQHEDPAVVWPALLGLGQNDRVTVKAQPPGVALLTQESHVERLEETVTPKDWMVTLGLSAAQAQEFAVWGTSTWGDARWSY